MNFALMVDDRPWELGGRSFSRARVAVRIETNEGAEREGNMTGMQLGIGYKTRQQREDYLSQRMKHFKYAEVTFLERVT